MKIVVFFALLGLALGGVQQAYLDPNGSDSNDCSAADVANACLTISRAVATGGRQVNIAPGTYSETTPIELTGDVLSIVGTDGDPFSTVIEFSALDGTVPALNITGPTSFSALIENVRLQDFTATGDVPMVLYNGPVLTLENSVFSGYESSGSGYTVVAEMGGTGSPSLTVDGCDFNSNVGDDAGMLHVTIDGISGSSLDISNTLFTIGDGPCLVVDRNDATTSFDFDTLSFLSCGSGAMKVNAGPNAGPLAVNLDGSLFAASEGDVGGCLHFDASATSGSSLSMNGTDFNSCSGNDGSSIYVDSVDVTMIDCEVASSVTNGADSGAISLVDSSLTMSDSTSVSLSNGIGIYVDADSSIDADESVRVSSSSGDNVLCVDGATPCLNCTACFGTGGACLLAGMDEALFPDRATDVTENGCVCAIADLLNGDGDCGQCQDPSTGYTGTFEEGECIDNTPGDGGASNIATSSLLLTLILGLFALLA